MTTISDINTIIRGLFESPSTGWAVRHPTVPLVYQGDDYDPPDQSPWARVTILGAGGSQIEYGIFNRYRRLGIVRVQFWLVAGLGSGAAYVYSDSIKEILEGTTGTGVRFFSTGVPQNQGVDGTWDQWSVDTDFDADELRLV